VVVYFSCSGRLGFVYIEKIGYPLTLVIFKWRFFLRNDMLWKWLVHDNTNKSVTLLTDLNPKEHMLCSLIVYVAKKFT
jgi:hypothetical protein